MSNAYCNYAQLVLLYDKRVVDMLSNDTNQPVPTTAVEMALDTAASRFDSIFTGRATLPISPMPLILTKYVAALAMRHLYARRSDLPDEVKADAKEADQWIKDYINARVNIPGQARKQPELTSSGTLDGTSAFDGIPYFSPAGSLTSTSKGK